MKKVLLTGGSSQIGQQIKTQCPYQIYAPTRQQLDLNDHSQLQKIDLSAYDIMILNAGNGMSNHEKFGDNDPSRIKNILDVNTISNFILINRYIACRQSGTILFVGSRATTTLKASNIVYSTSKLAVAKLLQSISTEYPQFNFLTVHPGKVKSRNNLQEPNRDNYIEPSDIANKIWYMIEHNIKEIYYNEK